MIAASYLAALSVFAIGTSGFAGATASLWLRRIAYAGLLALAALPSWVLLFLTPLVFLAGAGLIRTRVNPEPT